MNDHLKNFGVPLGGGSRGGILLPLAAYRFRVMVPELEYITTQVISVDFDFLSKTIKIVVRQAAVADSFNDAIAFASCKKFTIDAMDRGDLPVFTITPFDIKPTGHLFRLDYSIPNASAVHEFTFTYYSLAAGEEIGPAEHDGDPAFPAIEEFGRTSRAPLDLAEEMRITPDNPDTDGDGVPDKQDAFPLDPKKH